MAAAQRSTEPAAARAARLLDGIEGHPHAAAVLGAALPPDGEPSHAYLFHGPAGSGKRAVARAFAAVLLASPDGEAQDPTRLHALSERLARDAHPDLTWVTPSGAAELLVSDIEEPVVAAAVKTPFESQRRVFVIEAVETMNDQAANRMLKTLEEPPSFVHLILLTDRHQDVMPTIASRCLHVRFDPRPATELAEGLGTVEGQTALACARLAEGDRELARRLASDEGVQLRAAAEAYVRAALRGDTGERQWLALLAAGREAAGAAGELVARQAGEEAELLPTKERRRHEREAGESVKRAERRARTRTLDLALALAELWLRDLMCIRAGAPELVMAVDRVEELQADAGELDPAKLGRAVELVSDARLSLALNVSEELALEALAYRVQALLAPEG